MSRTVLLALVLLSGAARAETTLILPPCNETACQGLSPCAGISFPPDMIHAGGSGGAAANPHSLCALAGMAAGEQTYTFTPCSSCTVTLRILNGGGTESGTPDDLSRALSICATLSNAGPYAEMCARARDTERQQRDAARAETPHYDVPDTCEPITPGGDDWKCVIGGILQTVAHDQEHGGCIRPGTNETFCRGITEDISIDPDLSRALSICATLSNAGPYAEMCARARDTERQQRDAARAAPDRAEAQRRAADLDWLKAWAGRQR